MASARCLNWMWKQKVMAVNSALTPTDLADHAVKSELKPDAWELLKGPEGFCIQLLGLDSDGRAVYYSSDDGILARYSVNGEELEMDTNSALGPTLDSDSERVDPFLTAFVYLTERGEDWKWNHPRFRWAREELSELKLETEREV